MFCRKYGTKLNDTASFCTHCGERVVKAQEPHSQEPTDQPSRSVNSGFQPPSFKTAIKNSNMVKIALSVVAVIVVIITMHCMRNWAIWDVKGGVVTGTEDSGYDTLGEALNARFKQMQWSSKKSGGTHYVTVRGIDRQYEATHRVIFSYNEPSETWTVYDWYINDESFLDTTEGMISNSTMSNWFFVYAYYGLDELERELNDIATKAFWTAALLS